MKQLRESLNRISPMESNLQRKVQMKDTYRFVFYFQTVEDNIEYKLNEAGDTARRFMAKLSSETRH